MAPVLPGAREAMINWFIERIAYWNKDPAAIGLSPTQIADLANRLSAAETDLETATMARIDSKQATLNYYNTSDDLRNFGGDLIKTIKAFAETTDDPSVYTQAAVPPPSAPSPVGPPAVPTDISAEINNVGNFIIKWKGSRAAGTQFILQRQMKNVDGTLGNWTYAGSSATNSYTDNAVPTGFAAVNYRVYAQRSGGTSDTSITVTLNFGSGAGAGQSASGDSDLTLAA